MSNAMPSSATGIANRGKPTNEVVTEARFKGRRIQPLTIRLNHWMSALFLVLMAGGGFDVFTAVAPRGPEGAQDGWHARAGGGPPGWVPLARRRRGRRPA